MTAASRKRARQFGLTLPEILIALLIFSMISAAGVAGLRMTIDGRDQLEEADARLRDWQILQTTIREDLANLSLRTPRDEFGDRYPAAFIGGRTFELNRLAPVEGETPLFAFVRGGRSNPGAREPRSTLQYVEYLYRDSAIIRRSRPYVDDAPNASEADRILVGELAGLEASFLIGQTSRGLDWADAWPPPSSSGGPPRALRLTLTTDRFGEIEALFWIGELRP
ncbi:MAG: prepilin-type N-terminal cleavage/methylation domain-containing protein [Alphaproteobacteria bacterium]|nr:prepilin-type N-terminal cleavage/methylation domain-containing protein [Alphaproteobacteria bacterium]